MLLFIRRGSGTSFFFSFFLFPFLFFVPRIGVRTIYPFVFLIHLFTFLIPAFFRSPPFLSGSLIPLLPRPPLPFPTNPSSFSIPFLVPLSTPCSPIPFPSSFPRLPFSLSSTTPSPSAHPYLAHPLFLLNFPILTSHSPICFPLVYSSSRQLFYLAYPPYPLTRGFLHISPSSYPGSSYPRAFATLGFRGT